MESRSGISTQSHGLDWRQGTLGRPRGARTLFVIFGGSGDLARRKILPALEALSQGESPEEFGILAVGRSRPEDVLPGLRQGVSRRMSERVDYLQMGYDAAGFAKLAEGCGGGDEGGPANVLFHMAVPPSAFPAILLGLRQSGLIPPPGSRRWSRILIEKPFGLDLGSARELNALLRAAFDESQIFRLDHYVGKPAAHWAYSLRMAYPVLDAIWNARFIESIAIRSKETLGCADRSGYFDGIGILRDMIQSHLLQLLALAAMDAPPAGEEPALRPRRSEVLSRIAQPGPRDLERFLRGRYGAGQGGIAYGMEPGVPSDSRTETYARITVRIRHPRWEGVPFHLEAGKRMDRKETGLEIRFRGAGLPLAGGPFPVVPSRIRIRIYPEADIAADFPDGSCSVLPAAPHSTLFSDEDIALGQDGYAILFKHALEGKRSLFIGDREAEHSWACVEPVLRAWSDGTPAEGSLMEYPAGWAGPGTTGVTG